MTLGEAREIIRQKLVFGNERQIEAAKVLELEQRYLDCRQPWSEMPEASWTAEYLEEAIWASGVGV